jgi:hypothetical protein
MAGAASLLTAGFRVKAIKNASAEWAGMDEAVAFLKWMSSAEKNRAIRKSYVIATAAYRKDLELATPKSKYPPKTHKAKVPKPLWKTIGFARSKKYSGNNTLIDPLWVGHMVRKGAYHQHLLVRGTKAWKQDGTPTLRKGKEGKTRQKYFGFKTKDGDMAYGFKKKAKRGKDYVRPVRDNHLKQIVDTFGNSFILGMQKEARSAKYQGYLR